MRKVVYLINTFFLILLSKSVVFANELESEINYFVELAKSNISTANSWMSLLGVLTTVFAFAFVTVIIFILIQLYRLAKQVSANKRTLQTIEKHGESLTILARDTEEIRNQIRDQSLKARGITDEDYGGLLEDVLKLNPTPQNMNMVRNLVWTLFKPEEYKSGLEKLRKIFSNMDVRILIEKVKKQYYETFKENIDNRTLLTWIYKIKENNKSMDDLFYEEARKIIDYEQIKEEFWGKLVSYYTDKVRAAHKLLKEKGE